METGRIGNNTGCSGVEMGVYTRVVNMALSLDGNGEPCVYPRERL